MNKALLATIGIAGALTAGVAAQENEAATELAAIMEALTEIRWADHTLPVPEGVDSRYSDRLDAVSIDRSLAELEELDALGARITQLDRDALTADESTDAEILRLQLRDRINELRYDGYLLPIGSRYGFHFGFASMPESRVFRTISDYDSYIARLQSFPAHSGQQIAIMRHALGQGWVLPAAVMVGYEETAGQHVVERTEDSGFWAPFTRLPDSIPDADRERILADGHAAVEATVEAYRVLYEFFRDEYVPAGRPTLGVVDLPGNGRDFYEHRVRRYTTLDITPEEVHEVGLEQVSAIRAAMEAIREEVGFEGDWDAFLEFLRTDPRFYVDTPVEYLAHVSLAAKQMEGHLPELFQTLPRTPYGVRAIPDHVAPRQSAGYYDRGNADGTRGGWVNINTSQLDQRPLWVARALAYHEGVPGHHLQIMLLQENDALSGFRKRSGTTVFTEGWGLYTEKLGMDVGLMDDPYDRFGMWSYQIWRACRLVVDTGMHALGWSRERAIEFMADNTGMGIGPVTAEIDRHITEPGQGLAYTMGELEISALRVQGEQRLGDNFDLREFHDVVLGGGSLPLSVLRTRVTTWIDEKAAE
ncbi:MAG: DUF885 family protein [Acidobacteria bacterium]|nr:DUF885 family protein [Acidobacteriota bacterium]